MKQVPFEWDEEPPLERHAEVELDPMATEAVIPLMASLLIRLVRPAQEVDDEL
jgi:hypothetical protein